jgi:transposase
MHLSEIDKKSISDRAVFLESLGLDKKEIASMLGTSPASIAELMRQRMKKGDSGAKPKKNGK